MSRILEDFFCICSSRAMLNWWTKIVGKKNWLFKYTLRSESHERRWPQKWYIVFMGNNQKGECQWWQVQLRDINQRHQCLCPWSQTNKYQVRTKEREILTSNFTYNWRECKWMSNCYIKRKRISRAWWLRQQILRFRIKELWKYSPSMPSNMFCLCFDCLFTLSFSFLWIEPRRVCCL